MNSAEDSHDTISSNAEYILERILRKVHHRTSQKEPRIRSIDGRMDFDEIIFDYNMNDEIFEQLIFRETLLVSLYDGGAQPIPVGALALDVQKARGSPHLKHAIDPAEYKHKKFLVHVSSELDVEGENGGSRITSWVDRTLQTLEEKRIESVKECLPNVMAVLPRDLTRTKFTNFYIPDRYIRRDSGTEEKTLYISSQKNCYYLKRDRKDDIFYSVERAKNLVCEGASFILMRYLAVVRYVGRFEVATTYINGDLCRNIYECRGPSSGLVNDEKLDVCKIYRTIVEKCGIVHKCIVLLTLQGQILKLDWDECDYIIQLNPLAVVSNKIPRGNLRIPLEKKWFYDIELLSKYLDAKTETKKVIENYMNDNKEVRHLISDYVQSILHLKPEDVIDFTAKYFLSFSPDLLPRTEYFEPNYEDLEDKSDHIQWRYI